MTYYALDMCKRHQHISRLMRMCITAPLKLCQGWSTSFEPRQYYYYKLSTVTLPVLLKTKHLG